MCVGPRSAVFAPIEDLGLIVVDEEHEAAYKHEGDPRYDARTVAVKRAALDGVQLDPIGFKIGLEVIAKAHYAKAIEVPYVFTDRVAGESKLNQGEIFNYLRQLGRIYRGRLLGKRSG